jgi:exoribonuclease-2
MLAKGLLPDFSTQVFAELDKMPGAGVGIDAAFRDLTGLLWCSIDNDSSLDLDQLTVAENQAEGKVKILVAIADVDARVKMLSAIDAHASQNTLSVYTPAIIFPMLPEKLSTNLSSLNAACDRAALVVEMTLDADGRLQGSDIYGAKVRNQAKLAYNSVAAWLEGTGPMPEVMARVKELDVNIRLQDAVAQKMKRLRHEQGALSLETIETQPVFAGDELKGLEAQRKNRAQDIIENIMIGANGVVARFLEAKKFPSLRRVVHTPKRWDRIVELAGEKGFTLPPLPDAKALENFLVSAKATDPLHFPDLSLSVIKLLGPGEYALELPGANLEGHFSLAVKDYTHSTAPNRRFPDLITQRLLKAAISGNPVPYSEAELAALAKHCTEKEDDVKKVERQVEKSAAALLLEPQVGQTFDALVTGASEKGTWVRILQPPVEGKLTGAIKGLDVGQKLKVQLVKTDVERGYIDFIQAG